MSLSFAQSYSIVRQLGIKLHSTMKRAELEDKLKTTIAENDPMTLKIRIATDGMVFMIEREQIEKLLSPELQGIEFAKALSKFKEKK